MINAPRFGAGFYFVFGGLHKRGTGRIEIRFFGGDLARNSERGMGGAAYSKYSQIIVVSDVYNKLHKWQLYFFVIVPFFRYSFYLSDK
jgi:hypothetical protein